MKSERGAALLGVPRRRSAAFLRTICVRSFFRIKRLQAAALDMAVAALDTRRAAS